MKSSIMKSVFCKTVFFTLAFVFISCSKKDNLPGGSLSEFKKAISNSGIGEQYSIPDETFQDFLNEIEFNENGLSNIGYKSISLFLDDEDNLDSFRDTLREFIIKNYGHLSFVRCAQCSSYGKCQDVPYSDCYC